MSECTHDCSSCGASCGERQEPQDLHKPANELSSIKKVIAVVSGKGGVGKSAVTCSLAAAMAQRGKKVGVLDADITGPSVPKAFGVHQRAQGSELGIYPAVSHGGVELMSLNLLTERETDPVIWRGPVIAGAVQQFWTDVVWGDLDYLFVDMPPGTGDVQLTLSQSVPVTGAVVVTTPQDIALLDAKKGLRMFEKVSVPVLGIVENMALFRCPKCGHLEHIFGEGGAKRMSEQYKVPVLGQLPLDSRIREQADSGLPTVAADPDGEIASIYRQIALRAAAYVARTAKDMSQVMPSVKVVND